MKCGQPRANPAAWSAGRSRWTISTCVPPAAGPKRTSTVLEPGGRRSEPAWPREIGRRWGGSISRERPRTGTPLMSSVEVAARSRVEQRVVARPAQDRRGPDEVFEDALRARPRCAPRPGAAQPASSASTASLRRWRLAGQRSARNDSSARGPRGARRRAGGGRPADRDEARVAERVQMLGDRLLGDVEVAGDLVDRARPVAHQPRRRPPSRLGQGREGRLRAHVHRSVSTSLDLYKDMLV